MSQSAQKENILGAFANTLASRFLHNNGWRRGAAARSVSACGDRGEPHADDRRGVSAADFLHGSPAIPVVANRSHQHFAVVVLLLWSVLVVSQLIAAFVLVEIFLVLFFFFAINLKYIGTHGCALPVNH